jgi:hypothetical protein
MGKDMSGVLTFNADGASFDRLVDDSRLLAQAAERSLQVRERLVSLGDLCGHARVVQVDNASAAGAGQVTLFCQYSQALADLVSAVRAGDIDALV